jgi:hypothetical protein
MRSLLDFVDWDFGVRPRCVGVVGPDGWIQYHYEPPPPEDIARRDGCRLYWIGVRMREIEARCDEVPSIVHPDDISICDGIEGLDADGNPVECEIDEPGSLTEYEAAFGCGTCRTIDSAQYVRDHIGRLRRLVEEACDEEATAMWDEMLRLGGDLLSPHPRRILNGGEGDEL